MKQLENILGIGTFGAIVFGSLYAYMHDNIFPPSFLIGILIIGLVWGALYCWNLYQWWKAEKLFFTQTYRFPTMLTFSLIIGILVYLNFQTPYSPLVTFRYVIAFSFFLMIIANIKNFINFEDPDIIQFQDKGISVKWSHLEYIKFENQIFRFTTDKGKVYEVPLKQIHESRQKAFKQQIEQLIKRHEIDTTLRHLIDEKE